MAEGRVLRAEFRMQQGALALDVKLALDAPWTCLFGASGSGKTTILRAIAGFVRPETGRIVVGEAVVFDAEARLCVPAYARPVRTAAQQAWLMPGTVRENVGYGVVGAGVDEVLELFRLESVARVEGLSGGERQRVSLARAVAAAVFGRVKAGLLLLDEPFAGMDMGLRDELAVELRDWLAERGIPVLSVTHDVGEASLLGCEVVRVVAGRVVEQGSAGVVLAAERERLRGLVGTATTTAP